MRRTLTHALRGIAAGVAGLAFVLLFLLAHLRSLSMYALVGVLLIGVVALIAAAGPSAVGRLFGWDDVRPAPSTEADGWWLARLEPTLEDAWNTWSDLVLELGLGIVGLGSIVYIAIYPGDEPPIGLVVIGFLCITCSIVALAFVGWDE